MAKEKQLPPDASLLDLAAKVNAGLKGVNGQVNFYRIEGEDRSISTGIVFQCGVHRAIVRTQATLGEGDALDLIQNVTEWINGIRSESKWTLDPNEAA